MEIEAKLSLLTYIETVHLRCNLNPPKAGTQPKPRLGPQPTVFLLKSHTWSQDLLKLRFFNVSLQKEPSETQSDRQEEDLFKEIYLPSQKVKMALGEINFPDREWAISEEKGPETWSD